MNMYANPPKRRGLGKEDHLHKQFGALIKRYEALGKLNADWWSYDASGEKRDLKTGALLKAKGLRPGMSDYSFKTVRNNLAHYFYLEFKTDTGRQSASQKTFEESCYASNEFYHISRSIEDAVKYLEEEGVLETN